MPTTRVGAGSIFFKVLKTPIKLKKICLERVPLLDPPPRYISENSVIVLNITVTFHKRLCSVMLEKIKLIITGNDGITLLGNGWIYGYL